MANVQLPRDVEVLKAAVNSPLPALDVQWYMKDQTPEGYSDPEMPAEIRDAWQKMFQEMYFLAEGPDGEAVALWKYSEDVSWYEAPIVVLDTEGQLECRAATFAEYLASLTDEPQTLQSWLADHQISVDIDPKLIRAKVRFIPDPNERCQALQSADSHGLSIKDNPPQRITDLIGMRGTDPRVAQFLNSIEKTKHPLEIKCDRAGRVNTIFLPSGSIELPKELKWSDSSEEARKKLGVPVKSGGGMQFRGRPIPNWDIFIVDGCRMHVQYDSSQTRTQISLITLMELEE